MSKKRYTKKLWDNCWDPEAYIRYNTANDIYMLHGDVPKTVIFG